MCKGTRDTRQGLAWRIAHWAILFGGAAVALRAVLILGYVFASRLGYPMALEWCEGGMLLHTHQLLSGGNVYGPNDAVFLPLPYPPGYTLLVAAFSPFGLDFWTGRLVSILFFAAFCAVIFDEVRRQLEGKLDGSVAGLVAIATVVVAFPVVGGWYDLARVDSAFIGLSAVGAWGVSADRYTARRMLATAAVLTLAIYTKQTAAMFAAWIVVFAIIRDWRKGLLLAGSTFLLCAASLVLLQWVSDGHFWYWIFSNLTAHEIRWSRFWEGTDIVHTFAPFAALFPVGLAILAWRRRLSRRSVLWFGMLVCAVPVALLPYAKVGGYINNLMPMVMLVGPVAMLLLTDAVRRPWRLSRPILWTAIALATLFIWQRPIDPDDYIPTTGMREHAIALNEMIASLDGGVSIPHLPFLAVRNGHDNLQWHIGGYRDLDESNVPYDITATLERVDAEWLILPSRDHTQLAKTLRREYRSVSRLPAKQQVGMMVGYQIVLNQLYRQKE